ncbi:LOW QUALITY PROTEIN: C-signal [Sander vitreus]
MPVRPLARVRKDPHKPPLPSMFLTNARSLANKMEELNLLTEGNRQVWQGIQQITNFRGQTSAAVDSSIALESIEKSVEEVGQLVQEEGLNRLINNAAINVVADFYTVTAEKMIENYHTNAVAPLMIPKAFLPLLKQAVSRGGAGGARSMGTQRAEVINMTSLLGSVELNWGDRANNFKWYPYRVSKVLLPLDNRCMTVDLEPDGILCMAIHPGWVRTDMGGSEAPLSAESISSILSVIGGLTEKDHGSFLNFTGEVLPW